MEIGYTPEQLAMQQELRAYYEKLLDPATVAELNASHAVGAAPRRVWKQMCADGWAGIGWPKAFAPASKTVNGPADNSSSGSAALVEPHAAIASMTIAEDLIRADRR